MKKPINQAQVKQLGMSTLIWGALIIALLIIIAAPTLIVLGFGMVPTFVAVTIDRRKEKSAAITVGSINFIGVFPFLTEDLWFAQNTFEAAIGIITNLFSIMVMYSAAGFGWLLFLSLPTIISSIIILNQQRNMARLRGEQKDLIEEWGADVGALVEMERMVEQEPTPMGVTDLTPKN